MAPDPAPLCVAEDVWRITTPLPFRPRSVHAYLVRGQAGGWMLVDGGIDDDAAWSALDAGVRAVAGGWGSVRQLLITHMHRDHIGLVERARRASGAPVAMGRLDAERAAHAAREPGDEAEYRRRLLLQNGAPLDLLPASAAAPTTPLVVEHPLPESDGVLPGFAAWISVWTPGHTAGHVSLLRPDDGLLIAGDAVLPRITPTLGVNRQREDPVGDYLSALDRLAARAPALCVAGHGPPIEAVAERIAELRGATLEESAGIAELLDDEPASAWKVACARYAERELPASAWFQALRETRAHLDHLAVAGRAHLEWRGDVACFRRP